jgi:hypothetical protein
LKLLTDHTGQLYNLFTPGIDLTKQKATSLVTDLAAIFSADIDQQLAWYPYVRGIYQSGSGISTNAAGLPANSAFGGNGVGGGSFGQGTGILNRSSILVSALQSCLEGYRKQIAVYAAVDGIAGVVDLPSYAAYYNAITPFSVLFSPYFAAAYFYAYGGSKYLPASCVFAPSGILLGLFTITGANAGTLSANTATNFPLVNGYAVPVPTTTINDVQTLMMSGAPTGGTFTMTFAGVTTSALAYNISAGSLQTALQGLSSVGSGNVTCAGGAMPGTPITITSAAGFAGVPHSKFTTTDSLTGGTSPRTFVEHTIQGNSNNTFLGGFPMAQAIAPVLGPAILVGTTINGTCAVTVTALNQAGISHTWTATADNAVAGTQLALTPSTGGDRMNSTPTAIAVAGTATAGAFTVITTAERAY